MEKVEITVREMRNLYMALMTIAQKELPFKASYAIARTRRALEPEWEASEDVRRKLAEQKDQQKAEREWEDFLRSTIDVRVHQVDAELLGDNISPAVLDGLWPMLRFKEESKEPAEVE